MIILNPSTNLIAMKKLQIKLGVGVGIINLTKEKEVQHIIAIWIQSNNQ